MNVIYKHREPIKRRVCLLTQLPLLNEKFQRHSRKYNLEESRASCVTFYYSVTVVLINIRFELNLDHLYFKIVFFLVCEQI